jgi:hypothetical protein
MGVRERVGSGMATSVSYPRLQQPVQPGSNQGEVPALQAWGGAIPVQSRKK